MLRPSLKNILKYLDESSFIIVIKEASLLKVNSTLSMACFSKIYLNEQIFSGTVRSLFKKFKITGPLYCKVFLPVSDSKT